MVENAVINIGSVKLSPLWDSRIAVKKEKKVISGQCCISYRNHLIFNAVQTTGFYMKCNTELKWMKPSLMTAGVGLLCLPRYQI